MAHFRLPVLIAAALLTSGASFAKTVGDLSKGPPAYVAEGKLPEDRYEPFEVRKLKAPKLVWLNVDLLRAMGIQVGPQMTAALEKAVLDAFAWVAPDKHVDPNILTAESRTFYADYYGGWGIGSNAGSARAGVAGEIQSKGVGITPHLKTYDAKHTARSTLHESIKDAVWGEITQSELPEGGNRIIALIDRGSGAMENGEPQMIEIREDPLRAGHYVTREYGSDELDRKSTRNAVTRLENALPQPKNISEAELAKMTPDEKMVSGLVEYARGIGRQYGAEHMLRIYHGATSQSNIEITTRAIDFGTASTQPGYAKLQFLGIVATFGDDTTREVEGRLIGDTINNMVSHLPPERQAVVKEAIVQKLPADAAGNKDYMSKLKSEFRKSFSREAERRALMFTGVPEKMANELLDKHSDFARSLVALTSDGGGTINLQQVANFDALQESKIAQGSRAVAAGRSYSLASCKTALKNLVPADQLEKLAAGWSAFMTEASGRASLEGISPENFRSFVKSNATWINRPMTDLYLPNLRDGTKAANAKYLGGSANSAAEMIDSVVTNSRRTIPELGDYSAPIRVSRNQFADEANMILFNARTGNYEQVIRSRIFNGSQISVGGELVDQRKLDSLGFKNKSGQAIAPVIERKSEFVQISVPLKSAQDRVTITGAAAIRVTNVAGAAPKRRGRCQDYFGGLAVHAR